MIRVSTVDPVPIRTRSLRRRRAMRRHLEYILERTLEVERGNDDRRGVRGRKPARGSVSVAVARESRVLIVLVRSCPSCR